MGTKKTARNGLIDIMRLVFSLLVMMFHFYSADERHFPGGRYGVEFFVILSGYLFFAAWDQKGVARLALEDRQNYWLSYMKKRYVRYFWYALAAFLFAFFVVRIWHGQINSISSAVDKLSGDIWEILLVKMNGLNRGKGLLSGPAWTLSCMLLVEFFVLGMLTFWGRPFLAFLMPMSLICGTGYWMNMAKADHHLFLTFFTFGMLRVYLLTCCGIFSYWISQKLKRTAFSKAGCRLLTGAELTGYAVCFLITLYRTGRNYQFCFALAATLTLALSFSGKSLAGSLLPANAFTGFCAEFSLSVYLTHNTVLKIFRYVYEDINDLYSRKFVFLFCALAAALVYTLVMRGVFKMLPAAKQKLKSVILEQT